MNSGAPSTTSIGVRGLRKTFAARAGVVHAVDGIDLDIADGEFFCLLGPSGSGKTTLLRMIAGFELPTRGTIHLHGRDVTSLPPFDRDVNTVFQDYALFPHMSVIQNVEYGMRVRRVARAVRRGRAEEALSAVRLGGMEDRKPNQLSGGQRQRVALARALVNRPKVLLLDEPLGALDLKLRQEMQVELKALQHQVGITFVFVTHDQEEALTMSDRLAVFDRGRIEQVGTPEEVYERPATAFVAGFVGASNLIEAPLARELLGTDTAVTVRPERIRVAATGDAHFPPQPDEVTAAGTLEHLEFVGPHTRYRVRVGSGPLILAVRQNMDGAADRSLPEGTPVRLTFRRDAAIPIRNTETDHPTNQPTQETT